MGTRADFYIGAGAKAEWLGSVAWDGYEWAEDKKSAIMAAKTPDEFRVAVNTVLSSRNDATKPEQGWPWPWETSKLTDYVYWFSGSKTKYDRYKKRIKWPDMKKRQNITLGPRSGVMVIAIPTA